MRALVCEGWCIRAGICENLCECGLGCVRSLGDGWGEGGGGGFLL